MVRSGGAQIKSVWFSGLASRNCFWQDAPLISAHGEEEHKDRKGNRRTESVRGMFVRGMMTGIWASHEPTFSCQQYSCHNSLAESNRWLRGEKAGTLTARKWDLFARFSCHQSSCLTSPRCRCLRSIDQHDYRSLTSVFHDILKFSFGAALLD